MTLQIKQCEILQSAVNHICRARLFFHLNVGFLGGNCEENTKDCFKKKKKKKLFNHKNIWLTHEHFGGNQVQGRRQLSADIFLPVCLST